MTEHIMQVTRVDGRYVWATSLDGHVVGFGDVRNWEPQVDDWVVVELDSDEYPVWAARGERRIQVWP